jgi:hypothetical protein
MSDSIRIDVTGDRQVGLRFEEFPDELYDDLRREIDGLTNELLSLVRGATPDLTGKLRGEERARVFADEKKIKGLVDVAAPDQSEARKAGALEYGSTGKAVKMPIHTAQLDHIWDRKLAEPMTVIVKAFDRTPNIMEHAFERGPLEAMQPEILARLNAAVSKAVAKAND